MDEPREPSPVPREAVIERYCQQLELRLGSRFKSTNWELQLRLALLGHCLRMFGPMLNLAFLTEDQDARAAFQNMLPWWTEQARIGLKCL